MPLFSLSQQRVEVAAWASAAETSANYKIKPHISHIRLWLPMPFVQYTLYRNVQSISLYAQDVAGRICQSFFSSSVGPEIGSITSAKPLLIICIFAYCETSTIAKIVLSPVPQVTALSETVLLMGLTLPARQYNGWKPFRAGKNTRTSTDKHSRLPPSKTNASEHPCSPVPI